MLLDTRESTLASEVPLFSELLINIIKSPETQTHPWLTFPVAISTTGEEV